MRSLVLVGIDLKGEVAGSTNDLITLQKVDLAAPCSPWTISIGNGPLGVREKKR